MVRDGIELQPIDSPHMLLHQGNAGLRVVSRQLGRVPDPYTTIREATGYQPERELPPLCGHGRPRERLESTTANGAHKLGAHLPVAEVQAVDLQLAPMLLEGRPSSVSRTQCYKVPLLHGTDQQRSKSDSS